MLEIQSKRIEPDIVVVEIVGRITMGRECKQLEYVKSRKRLSLAWAV
jgi:hypothetical protein